MRNRVDVKRDEIAVFGAAAGTAKREHVIRVSAGRGPQTAVRQGQRAGAGAHEARDMESATGIRSAVGWRKVEDVVELMEAELILGNGSVQAGCGLMAALAKRMGEAREKHPWPEHADGKYQALGVVGEEYHELVIAVEKETPERMRDEALDVAVTALRMWAGEHERRGA